jgi:hypothetical protein
MIWLIKSVECGDGVHSYTSYHTVDTNSCPVSGGMLTPEGIAAISRDTGKKPDRVKYSNGTYEKWQAVASGDRAVAIQDAFNDLKMLRDRFKKYGININFEIV